MKYNKVNRRMFLQGSGGALLSIPFLHSLVPSEARAQTLEPIKRYLTINTTFDVGHARNWLPVLTPLSQSMPIAGSPHVATYDTLTKIMSDGRTQLSRILNASLNPYINDMMIYKGLDIVSHGYHGNALFAGDMAAMDLVPTSGNHTVTFDQFLASQEKFNPLKRAPIRVNSGVPSYKYNPSGPPIFVPQISDNPLVVYNVLFNKGAYPEADTGPVTHPRRDILTRVLGDYNRIKSGRQISSDDKLALEHAIDVISDLQNGLKIEAVASCKHKGFLDTSAAANTLVNFDSTLYYKNYVNLIKAIYLCDLSRILSFGLRIGDNYDPSGSPTPDYHGAVTHNPAGVYNGIPNWEYIGNIQSKGVTNFVAPLLNALSSIIDPVNGKSVLYNGLVHFTSETTYPHRQANIPTVTFGSLAGAMKTGYMINYSDFDRPFTFGDGAIGGGGLFSDSPTTRTNPMTDLHSYDYPGIPYQRFHVSILQALGLSVSDYEKEDPVNSYLVNRTDSLLGVQNNGITRLGGYGLVSPDLYFGGIEEQIKAYHFIRRFRRYNFHYFKNPLPMPVG